MEYGSNGGKSNRPGNIGPFFLKRVLCSPVTYKEGNIGPGEHRHAPHQTVKLTPGESYTPIAKLTPESEDNAT